MPRKTDHGRALDDDPLHDPTWPIFIYSAWALCSWYVDIWLGLVFLVGGTAALALAALRSGPQVDEPGFVTDFNVVLLFCAGGIGASVLALEALDRSQDLALAFAAYAAAAAIALDVRRRVRHEARARDTH